MAWTQYKKREGDVGFGNETAEILVATSPDGLQWEEPVPVTRDGPEQLFVDVFPTPDGRARHSTSIIRSWRAPLLGNVSTRHN
jgi:hypothetical protein